MIVPSDRSRNMLVSLADVRPRSGTNARSRVEQHGKDAESADRHPHRREARCIASTSRPPRVSASTVRS